MLNKQTFNAIEVCVCIAKLQHQISCSTSQLSSHLGLSVSYLELILKQLKAHEIVCSFRGPGGGYKILGSTSRVSIWDIAQIFEAHEGADLGANGGVVHDYEHGLRELVEATLREYTLADFSDGEPVAFKGIEDSANRFKFKPLVPAWVPKAPNSVFQLHLHS
jgi:Rrf2 family iron-sulfur cluster assembly transcriptional regulator